MISKPVRWTVEIDPRARKDLRALGSTDRNRVLRFLSERLAGSVDPREQGKALVGDMAGLWRYRVGAIRILAQLEHDRIVIYVVEIGNRRDVYR